MTDPNDTDMIDAADVGDESLPPPAGSAELSGERTEHGSDSDEPSRDWRLEYIREVSQSRKYRQRAQRAEQEAQSLQERALGEDEYSQYVHLRESAAGLADKDTRIEHLEATVRRIAAMDELNRSLVACGVGSACPHGEKMLAQASSLLTGRIDVEVTAPAGPAVRVLDETGQVMTDPAGQAVSVRQFVSHWLAEEGSHFLPASGDTGSGAHPGANTPPGASIEQLDRDPAAKAQFIAKHGPQAYVQLAHRR